MKYNLIFDKWVVHLAQGREARNVREESAKEDLV